jgi:hypothetical protein
MARERDRNKEEEEVVGEDEAYPALLNAPPHFSHS